MAKIIANEEYAKSVGGGSCSAYESNRAVTKVKAVSFGCTIRATVTYTDSQLVAKQDLQKMVSTPCSCNSHSYTSCSSKGYCSCDTHNCGYCYDASTVTVPCSSN